MGVAMKNKVRLPYSPIPQDENNPITIFSLLLRAQGSVVKSMLW